MSRISIHTLVLLLAIPHLVPLLATGVGWWRADPEVLAHLRLYVLPDALVHTVWISLGVVLVTALLGITLGALVALCEFPGRRWLRWALVLPIALPGYVLAVAWIGLMDYTGPIASALREIGLGWPEFRSMPGVVFVLSLSLYPYVYLVAREAFASQGARAMEVARALGHRPLRALLQAALPLARPAIVGALLLVAMEVLADFGTVSAFNIDTLTVAIYKAWFALFSLESALALAGVLLVLVIGLSALEMRWRGRRRFDSVGSAPARRIVVGTWATVVCILVLLLALAIPVGRLFWLVWLSEGDWPWRFAQNSVLLGGMAAASAAAAATVFAVAAREVPTLLTHGAKRLALTGYGMPGALLAIGLYVPVAALNAWLAEFAQVDWAIQGSVLLLVLALTVRFSAVALAPIDGALARIRPTLIDSARGLGISGLSLVAKVHLPLLRSGLLVGLLLVAIDTMKEMPITLMMRPFGWDTLATRVFELTQEGRWAEAAMPSLLIGLVGLLPIFWLERGHART